MLCAGGRGLSIQSSYVSRPRRCPCRDVLGRGAITDAGGLHALERIAAIGIRVIEEPPGGTMSSLWLLRHGR